MQSEPSEIVVLKPTAVFSSFLASQLPETDWPNVKLLHTDCTAYAIKKMGSEDETLRSLEKNFTTMFRHEICRWLGPDARNDIETSFLDFLCCFKFEFHSHLIIMEPSINCANQVLIIKPRTVLLNWLKTQGEGDDTLDHVMERVQLAHLTENATVLIKNFSDLKQIKPFLKQYCKPIFETAMSRMSGNSDEWPKVDSFESFSRFFVIEIHTQLVHLPC